MAQLQLFISRRRHGSCLKWRAGSVRARARPRLYVTWDCFVLLRVARCCPVTWTGDVNWLRRCSGYFWEIAWCSQNAVQQLTLSFVCLFMHPIWMDDFIEGAIFVITSYNNWTCDSSNKRQENEIYRHKFKNEYSFNSFKYIYGLELSSVNTEYDPLVPS